MEIHSNGSKCAGEPPDSVEVLLDVLSREPLDPRFERYGRFFFPLSNDRLRAWGNFLHVSHVFQIDGTLEEMLPLARAIKANRRRPDYLRQWASMMRRPGALRRR